MPKSLANALLYVFGWLACVLGGGPWLLVAGAALLIHLLWIGSWRTEGKLLVSTLLAGSALDSFLLQLGVFDFGDERTLIPLWLALTWALLGTTLNHCLAGSARPWWRASLLGAVLGPLGYFIIGQATPLGFPHGEMPTLLGLALLWAILLPLLHGFARLYREQYRLRQSRE